MGVIGIPLSTQNLAKVLILFTRAATSGGLTKGPHNLSGKLVALDQTLEWIFKCVKSSLQAGTSPPKIELSVPYLLGSN